MFTGSKWTPDEIALLHTHYQNGVAEATEKIPSKSRRSIMTKARCLGLKVSAEARRKAQARALQLAKAAKTENLVNPNEKPREPFDDLPDEYVKVGSIFRVGYRYSAGAQA